MDASGRAVGALLVQKKEDGNVNTIYYASSTLNDAEKKYSTSEREALAVIFAVRNISVYLLSSEPFEMFTDHQALQFAFQKNCIHGRLA